MKNFDSNELARLRSLSALSVIQLLAEYAKSDPDFTPVKSRSTLRIYVEAAGHTWELLVDGPRYFDVQKRKGGGGAIDLVMHLWQVPFKQAVHMLREAGA